MPTNRDVLYRIAEFMAPNPIVYCKLAMVNRDFYHVFTSDRLWRMLNPYGATENIINTLYTACNQSQAQYGLIGLFWSCTTPRSPESVRELTQNQFVWLGYLVFCCTCDSWDGFEQHPKLIKSVFDIDPNQFMWTSRTVRERYEYCLYAVNRHPGNFRHIPEKFEDDVVLFETAIQRGFIEALQTRGQGIAGYEQVVKKCMEQNPSCVAFLLYSDFKLLFSDRELLIRVVKEYPFAIMDNPQYSNDYEVNLAVVTAKRVYPMLEHINSRFQDDYELVFQAVKTNGTNIAHASERLRKQHCIKLAAIENWYPVTPSNRILKLLELFDRDELTDPDIARALVSHHGFMLRELRKPNDLELAMLAVAQNGKSIAYASDELKHNKSLALAAVAQSALAYQYIAADLRDEREILEAMVKQDGASLRFIPPELHDRELVQLAVQGTGRAFEYAGDELQNDKEIALIALKNWGSAYLHASAHLQLDKEVAYAAFLNLNGDQQNIPAELLADVDFMEPIIERYGTRLASLLDHRIFALKSVAVNPKHYHYLPKKYKQDTQFNLEAVKENGRVFNELETKFCMDKSIQAAIGRCRA